MGDSPAPRAPPALQRPAPRASVMGQLPVARAVVGLESVRLTCHAAGLWWCATSPAGLGPTKIRLGWLRIIIGPRKEGKRKDNLLLS